jgi:1-phosphofructokinase family hexose kinase
MLIAGPNLTIDRSSTLPELRPGEVLRVDGVQVTAGGKGLNVARAARALGHPAVLVGFVPGRVGEALAAMIAGEDVELVGVPIAGDLRSTAVLMEPGGRVTVINEPGPSLAEGDWEAFERALDAARAEHGVLACSGSVPPHSPPDAYARLVRLARGQGLRCVVDVAGPALEAALEAGPDLVTPNLGEAEGLLEGRAGEAVEASADARPRAAAAARGLVARGARAALVTAAGAGAALAERGDAPGTAPADAETRVTWLPAPAVTVRNPIGAGDALVGALAAALERGELLAAAARAGVAAGAASVEVPLAGDLDPARWRALLDRLDTPGDSP